MGGGGDFGHNSLDLALKIHLRATRAFLGLAKTTPTPEILSEFNHFAKKSPKNDVFKNLNNTV